MHHCHFNCCRQDQVSHPLYRLFPDTCNVDGVNANCLKSDPVIIRSVENEDRLGIRSQHFLSDSLISWSLEWCVKYWKRIVETRKWQEGQEVSVRFSFPSFKGTPSSSGRVFPSLHILTSMCWPFSLSL